MMTTTELQEDFTIIYNELEVETRTSSKKTNHHYQPTFKDQQLIANKMKTAITLLFSILISTIACEQPSLLEDLATATIEETSQIAISENNVVAPIVFIAGFDEGGNTFYNNAAQYFKNEHLKVVEGLYSLQEISTWLQENRQGKTYSDIHIVTHSNAWRGMSLKTTKNGDRITTQTLRKAIDKQEISRNNTGITAHTKIIFHSCGLGNNPSLLQLLQKTFSSGQPPQIVASPYFNVFGGKYAAHYLAQPHYVYYPTGHSPGPLALSQEIKTMYPTTNIDWFTALKTRKETTLGTPYSYRFNIPVAWNIQFNDISEIPTFDNREAIIDFISDQDEIAFELYKLGIPIEKFRWQVNILEGTTTLKIKGKTTVLCVLDPVMKTNDSGNYALTDTMNQQLYTTL